nr:uncharacterized protein LOC116426094 isoform X1 [Nomia melanderi]
MLKMEASILMLLLLSQYENVKGNPLSNGYAIELDNTEVNRHARTFHTTLKDAPRFPQFWSLLYPSFSMTNLPEDNDDDMIVLKQSIITLEKNQEEILKLLKQLTEATKTTSCVSPSVPISNNDNIQKESENVDEDIIFTTITNKKDIETLQGDKEEVLAVKPLENTSIESVNIAENENDYQDT